MTNFFESGKPFIIGQTEKCLEILTDYQHMLGNPSIPMTSIHPVIEQIEMEKETLVQALSTLCDGDGLIDILNQVIILSSFEVIRFNRGCYVTPC